MISSSKVEYISASCATKQDIWMRRIMEELNFIPSSPTMIYCDNKSSLSMTKNLVFQGRTKHIELCYHFIRDLVISCTIEVKVCSTKDQVADGLTKALKYASYMKFRGDLEV